MDSHFHLVSIKKGSAWKKVEVELHDSSRYSDDFPKDIRLLNKNKLSGKDDNSGLKVEQRSKDYQKPPNIQKPDKNNILDTETKVNVKREQKHNKEKDEKVFGSIDKLKEEAQIKEKKVHEDTLKKEQDLHDRNHYDYEEEHLTPAQLLSLIHI